MRITAILVFLLVSSSSWAQDSLSQKDPWAYLTGGLSMGNFGGRFLNFSLTMDEKICFQVGTSRQRQAPKEEPNGVIRDPFTSPPEKFDYLLSFYALGGYSFSINDKKTFRFELLAGPAFAEFNYHTNFELESVHYRYGAKYSSEIKTKQMAFFMFRPQIVVYPEQKNWIGFTIGTVYYLNPEFNSVGFEFGISIGQIGPKHPKTAGKA